MYEPTLGKVKEAKVRNLQFFAKAVFIPRWVRINTLKLSIAAFRVALERLSLVAVTTLDSLKDTQHGYILDTNVTNLVAFHPSFAVQKDFSTEYSEGILILQDKASCIPADLLDVPRGGSVLDACAAPGNKTTQLAAAVGRDGHVIAVEKDPKRVQTLNSMIEKAGASDCIIRLFLTNQEVTTIINANFSTLDPLNKQFAKITHVLLDPSCSGSGLDRLDYNQSEDLETRLRNLSTFQYRLLKHALSFPAVKRVVYSTCSIHAEENERVVKRVLDEHHEWRLLTRNEQISSLRMWPRRGLQHEFDSESDAEACIRTQKGTDGTIGFFAVGFVRRELSDVESSSSIDEEEEWEGISE